jgi:hypothetical protein
MVTPGNIPGMGEVSLPANPGTLDGFANQEVGSGDLAMPAPKKKKKLKNIKSYEDFNVLEFARYPYVKPDPEDNTKMYHFLKNTLSNYPCDSMDIIVIDSALHTIRIEFINNGNKKIRKFLNVFISEDGVGFEGLIFHLSNNYIDFSYKRAIKPYPGYSLFVENKVEYLKELRKLIDKEFKILNDYDYDQNFYDLYLIGINDDDDLESLEIARRKTKLFNEINAHVQLYHCHGIDIKHAEKRNLFYLISMKSNNLYHVYFKMLDLSQRKYQLVLVYNHTDDLDTIVFRNDGFKEAFFKILDKIKEHVLSNE